MSKRHCNVVGCGNNGIKLNKWKERDCEIHGCKYGGGKCVCDPPFVLYTFPTNLGDPLGRKRWASALKRKNAKTGKDWQPNYDSRVCSDHFIESKPTSNSPYPTLKLGYNKLIKAARKPPKDRSAKPDRIHNNQDSSNPSTVSTFNLTSPPVPILKEIDEQSDPGSVPYESSLKVPVSKCVECEEKSKKLDKLKFTATSLHNQLLKFKTTPRHKLSFGYHSLNTDDKVRLYTGFPNKKMLSSVISQLKFKAEENKIRYWDSMKKKRKTFYSFKVNPYYRKLRIEDEFTMVFMRIRLGLLIGDLGERFGVSSSTVSRITTTFIKFMASEFSSLIFSPDKEDIDLTCLPKSFQSYPYRKVRHIIDCTEFFIETPKNLFLQSATWSNYKHHNTIKILVSVFPTGAFNFVSQGYGGRTSDKQMVSLSGFLNEVEPGDRVMADRGFLIRDALLLCQADLLMPPGKRGQDQMTTEQVSVTKQIANRRIVVEQSIRRMKTFRILKYELPISVLGLLDDIIIICAAISNLMQPIAK